MDLIYTDDNGEDVGIINDFELDLEIGQENDFECAVPAQNNVVKNGAYIYFEGTEYGGIVDAIESNTEDQTVRYTGRTWHGILNSKIIRPNAGEDYLVLTGEANSILSSLITRMGISSLFEASSASSGVLIVNYKMDRYIKGYDGIKKMLSAFGGKLLMSFNGTKVTLSAVPAETYNTSEDITSDTSDFAVKKVYRTINHLICLGKGELADRIVVDLYCDADGNISETPTYTGIEDYSTTYENTSSEDEDALIEDGTKKFKELINQNDLSVSFDGNEAPYDIGDSVFASDEISKVSATVMIAQKIVSVKDGVFSISYSNTVEKIAETAQVNAFMLVGTA